MHGEELEPNDVSDAGSSTTEWTARQRRRLQSDVRDARRERHVAEGRIRQRRRRTCLRQSDIRRQQDPCPQSKY